MTGVGGTGVGGGAAPVRIGVRPPHPLLRNGTERLHDAARRMRELGFDHAVVGDHVSFRGGYGSDGLIQATALLVAAPDITVHTGVFLLPLRHPVPVARQVATLAAIAPGRFVFGVGIGGEDRAEVEACGVDPATRGRRMDEALAILRALLAGEAVTVDGEHFRLREVRVSPPPPGGVPIVIGGRSAAAVRRAGRHGDGWLGVWISPDRFASVVADVDHTAVSSGRHGVVWRHGLLAWCGFGRSVEAAGALVSRAMEDFYGVPFERFSKYVPRGTPQDVAEALAPYLEAGCRDVHLLPVAGDEDEALESAAEVRRLLLKRHHQPTGD
ncbi:LLM class flavin-dependent oxidoreductase [Frankia sp. Cppng1_Ct_nod]|uniref:LLM class flavin-dependent oxidoreductase n=1 Tax=Frankia sp. Cppng1_Ct_nod TaxID=2897162 RepID=UPI0013EF9D6E|nr:LLM class flavin-dependent oxidoreductase [Frankia sp. Cppng1_Ct_nod]